MSVGALFAPSAILISGAVIAGFLPGCAPDRTRPADGVLVVSQEQTAAWIRNFNPLTTATGARWPTLAGIYEPLFVFNSIKAEMVPWLAVSHEWRNENRLLRLKTRTNVAWSDGVPFSADDVAYTFELLRRFPALDRRGVWSFLQDIRVIDDTTVDFSFKRAFVPGFGEIAAQPIVPKHIWQDVEDPVSFPNDTPIATGPFTEVRVFRNQIYELGRNPNYWQEGLPKVTALRFPAYPANDRANLALVFDEVDWAGNFIPAIDRVFVGRNPKDHAYWFPLTGSMVFLYANTTRAPFDDVRVREALSRAIDRTLLVDVAVHRYSRPSDATGLSDAYRWWHSPEVATSADWTKFDVARAAALLDQSGHRLGPDGIRRLPDGSAWNFQILTVSGWSDWVRAAQVISNNLREVGINASVRTYDFGAWFQAVQEGNFDLTLGWSNEGATPYVFYKSLMSKQTAKPVGTSAGSNWHRFTSVAADSLLAAFEGEADTDRQRALGVDLQRVFASEIPAIPLYPNPSWAEFNTARFEGFPSAENPYADPSPNKFERGEILLVLTTLRPR